MHYKSFLAAISCGLASPLALSATLLPPTIDLASTSQIMQPGDAATLTLTLGNPNAEVLTGISFTYYYPPGLFSEAPFPIGGSCTGLDYIAEDSNFELNTASLAANTSCTITVPVKAIHEADRNGSISQLISDQTAVKHGAATLAVTIDSETYTWQGSASSAWDALDSWSTSIVPDMTSDALIIGGDTVNLDGSVSDIYSHHLYIGKNAENGFLYSDGSNVHAWEIVLGHNSETAGDMTAALHVRNADINSDEIRMVESDLPGHYTVELVFDNGTINTNSINMPYSSVHSDEVLTIDSKLELKNATINTTSATDLGGNLRAASNSSNVQGQFNNTITFDNVVFNSGGDIEIASDLLNGSNSTGNHVGINTVLTIKKSTINAIDLEFARWNNSNTGSQNGSSSNTITADISDSTLILQNLYISDVSAKGDNTTLYTQDINLNISNSTVTATGQLEMLEYGVGAEARSNSAVVLSVNNSQMTFGADLFMAEDLQFTDALALSETVATAALQLNRSEMTFGETMFLADMGEEDMGLAVNVDMQANLQAVNSLISAQELRAGSGMGKSTIQLHNSLLTLKDMDDGVAGDTDTLLIDEASLTLGQTNTLSLTLAGSQRADNTVVLSNDNFYSAIDAHQVTLGGTLKVAINQEAVASGRTEFDLIRAVAIDDSVTLGESAVRGIHGAFDTVSYVLEEGITVDKTEIVRENIAGIDYDIYRLYVAYEQTEQPTVASNSGSDSGHTPLSGLLLLLSLLFIRRR